MAGQRNVMRQAEDAGRGVRTGKDCGYGKLPSQALAMNKAWFAAALIAACLIAWLKLIALDGDIATAEPKTLRYRIFHAATRLVKGARRRRLKIAVTWPWADAIVTAWHRLTAMPPSPLTSSGPVPAARNEPRVLWKPRHRSDSPAAVMPGP
jgi:hypothetical protein